MKDEKSGIGPLVVGVLIGIVVVIVIFAVMNG